ncbi:abortive infection bacteriophage resistance protein [Bacteroides heparinolyticus]|uniref:Abortive infection bacteriophage resistance protein n=1 Tax=Prevotella heparinolytica TaxID=28113 RepID=A0A4R2M4E3_9BACE|nr:Abi family protein [Bacteroides heparinolyticus]TCO90276.1 abortive infection bacteriophage resistance protein [Bacteroides heparinolyticus]
MAHYTKTYSSPSRLVALLQSRGLHVENIARAENYLRHIGYYRFSAYLYPLLATPKEQHLFKPGAAFNQALDMYRFDRHLRLLMFNEIEKIEIAVRSAIVNITSRETGNPFWMTDPSCFYDANTFAKTKQLIDVELTKSREDFIEHFRNAYSDPYPPAWMLVEILPLGVLTKIYDNIKSNQIRKKIAQEFALGVPVFNSWMTIITVARNNCGHHARVWNRTFALRVLTQRRMARLWITIPVNQKKAYFSLCIIKYFLNIISPNNDMKAKIDALLSAYPSIDMNAMGFPDGWEAEPLWDIPAV